MSLFVVFVLFAVFVGHAPAWYVYPSVFALRSWAAASLTSPRPSVTNASLAPSFSLSRFSSFRPAYRYGFCRLIAPSSRTSILSRCVSLTAGMLAKQLTRGQFTLALCALALWHHGLANDNAGFLFGRLSTRIILAHLTKGNFPMSILNLFPLAVGASLVTLPSIGLCVFTLSTLYNAHTASRPALLTPQLELLYLHGLLVYSCARFAFSSHRIIDAFCRTLGIRTLSIT